MMKNKFFTLLILLTPVATYSHNTKSTEQADMPLAQRIAKKNPIITMVGAISALSGTGLSIAAHIKTEKVKNDILQQGAGVSAFTLNSQIRDAQRIPLQHRSIGLSMVAIGLLIFSCLIVDNRMLQELQKYADRNDTKLSVNQSEKNSEKK